MKISQRILTSTSPLDSTRGARPLAPPARGPEQGLLLPPASEATTPRGLGYHFDESEFVAMDGNPGSVNVTP